MAKRSRRGLVFDAPYEIGAYLSEPHQLKDRFKLRGKVFWDDRSQYIDADIFINKKSIASELIYTLYYHDL